MKFFKSELIYVSQSVIWVMPISQMLHLYCLLAYTQNCCLTEAHWCGTASIVHLGTYDDMVHVFLKHKMILVSKEQLEMGLGLCQLPVHSQELPGGMQVSITQK